MRQVVKWVLPCRALSFIYLTSFPPSIISPHNYSILFPSIYPLIEPDHAFSPLSDHCHPYLTSEFLWQPNFLQLRLLGTMSGGGEGVGAGEGHEITHLHLFTL